MHKLVSWCGVCRNWIEPDKSAMVTVPGIRVGAHALTCHPACYSDAVIHDAPSAIPGCTGALRVGRTVGPPMGNKALDVRRLITEERTLKAGPARVADVNSDEAVYEVDL